MSELPEALKDLFEKFDRLKEPISPHVIDSEIQKTVKEIYGDNKEFESIVLAELMAFKFCENYSNDITGWGTYYGPLMVFPDKNGQAYESPSIKRISHDIINHWGSSPKKLVGKITYNGWFEKNFSIHPYIEIC